jgi:hypothetical protein
MIPVGANSPAFLNWKRLKYGLLSCVSERRLPAFWSMRKTGSECGIFARLEVSCGQCAEIHEDLQVPVLR